MAYILDALAAIWVIGTLILAGLHLNDIRRILNNLVPGAPFVGELLSWKLPRRGRITKIDPEFLNEAGRAHLAKAVWHERISIVWMFGGFFLVSGVHYYMNR